MAQYDYGLRGPSDTTPQRAGWWAGQGHDEDVRLGPRRPGPQNRVTARYNMDYLRERGPAYPRNANALGGDWPGQIGGEQSYRPPYLTRGGTWTHRGMPPPQRYDYRDFGPGYGGRYPDEI